MKKRKKRVAPKQQRIESPGDWTAVCSTGLVGALPDVEVCQGLIIGDPCPPLGPIVPLLPIPFPPHELEED